MSVQPGKIIGALEVGTAKIVALIGEVQGPGSLNIIGMGQASSAGVRKGEVHDFRAAGGAVHAALLAAEKNAKARLDELFVGISGGHLQSFSSHGSATIEAADGSVSETDLQRASLLAKSRALDEGRVYIHHMHTGWLLDGSRLASPIGHGGTQLESHYLHLHGDERKVSALLQLVEGLEYSVGDLIAASVATGSLLLTEAEKSQGALVIDIGCGTTDYALYRFGKVQQAGSLALGGDHFTNDLALGLRVNLKNAERVKLRFGRATVNAQDKADTVLLIGDLSIGDRPIPRLAISRILHARAEEIFMLIKNRLGSAISRHQLPGGVILTGGSARLEGLATCAGKVLDVDTRTGELPSWVTDASLRSPEYSAVLGLLFFGLTAQEDRERTHAQGGWLRKITRLFAGGEP